MLGSVMAVSSTAGALVESYLYGAFGELLSVTDSSGNPIEEPHRIGNPVGAFGMWLVSGVGNLAWVGGGVFFNKDTGKKVNGKGEGEKKLKALQKKRWELKNPTLALLEPVFKKIAEGTTPKGAKALHDRLKWKAISRYVEDYMDELTMFHSLWSIFTGKDYEQEARKEATETWNRGKAEISKNCDCKELFKFIKRYSYVLFRLGVLYQKGDFSKIPRIQQDANAAGEYSKDVKNATPCVRSAIMGGHEHWFKDSGPFYDLGDPFKQFLQMFADYLKGGLDLSASVKTWYQWEMYRTTKIINKLLLTLAIACSDKPKKWWNKNQKIYTPYQRQQQKIREKKR